MPSIDRPSRRVRASATAMRYWGLRILPSRVSLILTAMVELLLLIRVTLQFSDTGGAARIRFCLACVTAEQHVVARQTAAHCARTHAPSGNPPAGAGGYRV